MTSTPMLLLSTSDRKHIKLRRQLQRQQQQQQHMTKTKNTAIPKIYPYTEACRTERNIPCARILQHSHFLHESSGLLIAFHSAESIRKIGTKIRF